jgi:hypothetical protein
VLKYNQKEERTKVLNRKEREENKMTLKEKMYSLKTATKLTAIALEASKNPNAIHYLKFNALKSEVANTCLTKGYTVDIYTKLFSKSLDEWIEEIER